MLIVGPNGAGKTNLLESLHVGTQGFSPRTRADTQLVRFGERAARVRLEGHDASRRLEVEVTLHLGEAKRARLNGADLRTAEQLRGELATLVFTPDRLVVVKGAPAARRAYFDRALARLLPARGSAPVEYAAAVAQRNAALRRVATGLSTRGALEPWTERVLELADALTQARHDVLALLQPGFNERAGALGLSDAALAYEGEPVTREVLESRLDRDLDRGTTGAGPHLHDVVIRSGERDLRAFGSQGEQRLAVLALLLAEAELLAERRGSPPLLLLDDVLSELDETRRLVLAEWVSAGTQAVVTATSRAALPIDPTQLVEVGAGTAKAVA